MAKHSVLFVCLGNICRSPTAEGIFKHKVQQRELTDQFDIDSAGTGDWHIGSPPDNRARAAAASRGFDIDGLRARQVKAQDFQHFDYVIAMDYSNQRNLRQLSDPRHADKVYLLLEFSDSHLEEVPDPYYGGDDGFNQVIDLIEEACEGLLSKILS